MAQSKKSYDQEVSENYSRIRNDPVYRQAMMLEYLEDQSLPALSVLEPEPSKPVSIQDSKSNYSDLLSRLRALEETNAGLMKRLGEMKGEQRIAARKTQTSHGDIELKTSGKI